MVWLLLCNGTKENEVIDAAAVAAAAAALVIYVRLGHDASLRGSNDTFILTLSLS